MIENLQWTKKESNDFFSQEEMSKKISEVLIESLALDCIKKYKKTKHYKKMIKEAVKAAMK